MFDIFKFFRKKETEKANSSIAAKDRLKLVLLHDRTSCSPEMLEQIKYAFLKAIENFVEIDRDNFDIKISQTEDKGSGQAALEAIIPIKSMNRASKKSANENKRTTSRASRKRKK